jgi:hypothetical protein
MHLGDAPRLVVGRIRRLRSRGFRHPRTMPQDGVLDLGSVSYTSRVLDERALVAASDEQLLLDEAYQCLMELGQSVDVVGAIHLSAEAGQRRGMTRDEVIVARTMVRAAKLRDFLVEPWCSLPRNGSGRFGAQRLRPASTRSTSSASEPPSYSTSLSCPRLEKEHLARVQHDVDGQLDHPTPIQAREEIRPISGPRASIDVPAETPENEDTAPERGISEWAIQDSNLGPLPYQRSALTD